VRPQGRLTMLTPKQVIIPRRSVQAVGEMEGGTKQKRRSESLCRGGGSNGGAMLVVTERVSGTRAR
jgi:hypothetical protein